MLMGSPHPFIVLLLMSLLTWGGTGTLSPTETAQPPATVVVGTVSTEDPGTALIPIPHLGPGSSGTGMYAITYSGPSIRLALDTVSTGDLLTCAGGKQLVLGITDGTRSYAPNGTNQIIGEVSGGTTLMFTVYYELLREGSDACRGKSASVTLKVKTVAKTAESSTPVATGTIDSELQGASDTDGCAAASPPRPLSRIGGTFSVEGMTDQDLKDKNWRYGVGFLDDPEQERSFNRTSFPASTTPQTWMNSGPTGPYYMVFWLDTLPGDMPYMPIPDDALRTVVPVCLVADKYHEFNLVLKDKALMDDPKQLAEKTRIFEGCPPRPPEKRNPFDVSVRIEGATTQDLKNLDWSINIALYADAGLRDQRGNTSGRLGELPYSGGWSAYSSGLHYVAVDLMHQPSNPMWPRGFVQEYPRVVVPVCLKEDKPQHVEVLLKRR